MNKNSIRLRQKYINANAREMAGNMLSKTSASRRRHIVRLYLTAILLLSMMLTVYVWQSTKMVEIKLRIKKIEANIRNITSSNTNLTSEISTLQSISRIETIAKNELGMVVPKKLYYIKLPDNIKDYE